VPFLPMSPRISATQMHGHGGLVAPHPQGQVQTGQDPPFPGIPRQPRPGSSPGGSGCRSVRE
jgi:hypothetical protein